jgi:transcriptional regulator with XRE-family HTH domain
MGGPNSGRRPDEGRRRQILELRAQGLTLAEIGRRLGISRQAVQGALKGSGVSLPRRGTVSCQACGGEVLKGEYRIECNGPVLCRACLAERPRTPFGQRLRSLRLAAGLTQTALARRAGLCVGSVRDYERGRDEPRWANLMKLLHVLGFDLLADSGREVVWRSRGRPRKPSA